jgi:hypothetical protein
MKTMKILSLAAFTALTFGVGGAMAQSAQVPAPMQSQAAAPQASGTVARTHENTVQYGSSDHGFAVPKFSETDQINGGF